MNYTQGEVDLMLKGEKELAKTTLSLVQAKVENIIHDQETTSVILARIDTLFEWYINNYGT